MSKIVDWWNSTKTFSTEKLHRARKMKFWRYHLILLPDCSKVFTQEPELLKKRTFSRKENRPISFTMRRKELGKTCQKMQVDRSFFLLIVRKSNNKPDSFFYKTRVSLKFPSWHVEYCFGNFAWLTPANGWKTFA